MNCFLLNKYLQVPLFLQGIIIFTLIILTSACSEKSMKPEIILIEEGDYMYPAKVTKTYAETDQQIHVYIFNDTLREEVGNSISTDKLAAKRAEPSKGWGARQVALQFFWNGEWIYAEDVTEFEDHYLIPINKDENLKIELKHIRFPIPVRRSGIG